MASAIASLLRMPPLLLLDLVKLLPQHQVLLLLQQLACVLLRGQAVLALWHNRSRDLSGSRWTMLGTVHGALRMP